MTEPVERPSITPARLLACALWMGLAYGLLEATGLSAIRLVPWVAAPLNGTTLDILWVGPLEYAVLFGLVGVVLVVAQRLAPGVRWDIALVFLLSWAAAFLFLDLQDHRLANYASAALGCGAAVQMVRWYRPRARRCLAGMVGTLPYVSGFVIVLAIAVVGGQKAAEALAVRGIPPAVDPTRPNVLLLVVDTLRADHSSSYGYQRLTTPRLDRLAGEGMLFERAHSPSSWTLPSHASIMTGRLPHEHLAGEPFRPFLDSRYPTLAQALRDSGYVTGGFVANTFWTGRQVGLSRGFVRYSDYFSNVRDAAVRPIAGRKFGWELAPKFGWRGLSAQNRAEVMNQHLLEWLDQLDNRPFFAFVNYMDVHGPFLAPPPFSTLYAKTPVVVPAADGMLAPTNDAQAADLTERIKELINGYDGSLVYVDQAIGQLLDALEQRGLSSNTLVIVTSDHGESFGEHGLVSHGNSVYLEQTHVPLIMRFPGRLPAGVRKPEPVSLVRLPSTILNLIGRRHEGFDAVAFAGPGADSHEPTITEVAQRRYVPRRWPSSRGWTRSLIAAPWHFLLSESGETELYDFSADPGEIHNVSGEVARKPIVDGFRRDLTRATVEGALHAPAPDQAEDRR